jgi:hypothetical protein
MLITVDPLFIVLARSVNHNKIAYYKHIDDEQRPHTSMENVYSTSGATRPSPPLKW